MKVCIIRVIVSRIVGMIGILVGIVEELKGIIAGVIVPMGHRGLYVIRKSRQLLPCIF